MTTQLIRFLSHVSSQTQGGILTLGNFDGLHLGHKYLIDKVIAKAKALGRPSIAITFEPHAAEYFAGQTSLVPRLTRFREKFSALADCGLDYVLILKFNQELASLSPKDFITQLIENLQPSHFIVGDDFHFGHNRQGDFALLTELGQSLGFTAERLTTVENDQERISSTRVRKALAEGDHALVKRLLGRTYTMMGRVGHGDKRGRQWGFPTANIYLHRRLTPVRGVYTVLVHGIGNQILKGVANVGMRPTIDGTRTLLEVHLLDFNRDIYGCYVTVEFCKKLREEQRFPNIEQLKEQITQDVLAAKAYFDNLENN